MTLALAVGINPVRSEHSTKCAPYSPHSESEPLTRLARKLTATLSSEDPSTGAERHALLLPIRRSAPYIIFAQRERDNLRIEMRYALVFSS